ncbi:GL22483 [Drosophila persimilis]|uniref:GL22483 n=1 Tax=Drosophila persimilis TaxID=7234 RepID=B4H1G6_DROPE|nr:2-aminoethanethiol dioxygenase [Drosophila persimilis]EDW30143.1 GL22483 [Drosophila persimilis]
MTAHFMNVLRQAFKTFDRANHASFNTNLQHLKQLTDELTYRDLHIKEELFRPHAGAPSPSHAQSRAPCSYMHIFEDERFSMSLFIVRGSSSIPLHDHPMMFGLLRCIWGKLLVQSYTQQLGPDEPLHYDTDPIVVKVNVEEPCLVSPDTPSAMVTPRKRNYHHITEAGNGVAAFFDILSPPYDADMPMYGPRSCRFYRPKSDGGQTQLHCIPSPATYYCDVVDTPKTVLQCAFKCADEDYAENVPETQ